MQSTFISRSALQSEVLTRIQPGVRRHLGCSVTVIGPELLPRESPSVRKAMAHVFVNESGIELVQGRVMQVPT